MALVPCIQLLEQRGLTPPGANYTAQLSAAIAELLRSPARSTHGRVLLQWESMFWMRAPGFSKDVDSRISENWLFCSHGDFWLLKLMFGNSAQAAHMSEPQIRCGAVDLCFTGLCELTSLWVKHVNSVNWDTTKILGIAGVLDHQSLHLTLASWRLVL